MAKTNSAPSEAHTPDVKYQLSKLRANAETIFGVSDSTFAGATAKLPDGEYTVKEIKEAIKEWQKKEVK